jgi:hypothetical protein
MESRRIVTKSDRRIGRPSQERPETMRGHRWLAVIFLSALTTSFAGCSGTGSRRSAKAPEPGLSGALDSGTTIVADPAPAKSVTYVDRHPLFSKPRDYWDGAGDNKFKKAAAATFVGVPVGLYGEMKQIVVGAPAETK